jgi:hypothetical protein
MVKATTLAPALLPINGRAVLLNSNDAEMSFDAGLTLREIERRHDLGGLMVSCLIDLRELIKVQHSFEEIIHFRIMMISAGYEDGNDANALTLKHKPKTKF